MIQEEFYPKSHVDKEDIVFLERKKMKEQQLIQEMK